MSTYMTVLPAYGRDYTSVKAVRAAWAAGSDFIINQYGHPYNGKPINKPQADSERLTVHIRYAKHRKITQAEI